MSSKIIAEVGFNRHDDMEEFSPKDRIIDIYSIGDTVYLTFDLGRKDDDRMTLTLEATELTKRLREAEEKPD